MSKHAIASSLKFPLMIKNNPIAVTTFVKGVELNL